MVVIVWRGEGGRGGGDGEENGSKNQKLLRMSWNTLRFCNIWNSMKFGKLQILYNFTDNQLDGHSSEQKGRSVAETARLINPYVPHLLMGYRWQQVVHLILPQNRSLHNNTAPILTVPPPPGSDKHLQNPLGRTSDRSREYHPPLRPRAGPGTGLLTEPVTGLGGTPPPLDNHTCENITFLHPSESGRSKLPSLVLRTWPVKKIRKKTFVTEHTNDTTYDRPWIFLTNGF